MIRDALIAVLLTAGPAFATAAQAPSPRAAPQQVSVFLEELKGALAKNDRPRVTALLHFPLTVSMNGLRVPISAPALLLDRYDDIFTPEMREAISRADPGVFDLTVVEGQLKVSALRVPYREASVGSSADRSEPSAARTSSGLRQLRRIIVRAGPRPTQVAGILAVGAPDVYVVTLAKGQLLEARVERAGRAAIVRVVDAKSGTPLNPRSPQATTAVSGLATTAGDYRIEVHGTSSAAAGTPYMLSLNVR